jgi:RNA polymerase sigma factor (sigma-70 family)
VFRNPRFAEQFRSGDEEALTAVYAACVDYVTRIADAVLRACARGTALGAVATALPDVVQEVFLKAFAPEARRRFDTTKPYEPYLAQIARNVAVDHWRQMRRYVPSDIEHLIDRLALEMQTGDASTGEWADGETVTVVNRYLASLDDESRRIHDALYVKGMSQRDAAQALGIGRQVIRSREAKLRQGLRRELSQATAFGAFSLQSAISKSNG